MKNCKKIIGVLLCVLFLLSLHIPVRAESAVSLKIVYEDGGKPLVGAAFDIYLVATMDAKGELTVSEAFEEYPVNIEYTDNEGWRLLASTLEGYVLRDGIAPADSGVTDKKGELLLPTERTSLERGIYLVMGHRHEQEGFAYEAASCIAILPSVDESTHEWVYDVTLRPKFTKTEVKEYVNRKVLKVWEDEGFEELRPTEIIVDLLQNGTVYDTVVLTEKNGWRYTWENLDGSFQWTVAERELEDYTVVITQEEITFVITNTWDGEVPPPPTEPPPPSTPNSGQLWWPVPVLTCGGMLLMVLGLYRRKETGYEE